VTDIFIIYIKLLYT